MAFQQVRFIEEIINKFGPRRAGSSAEDQAQNYILEKLREFCNESHKQSFSSALTAKFQSLKIFCLFYVSAFVLSYFNNELAMVVSALNSILFFLHFNSYHHILDFMFPQIQSSNVTGIIEPQEKVKQTIIFSGHIDSTPEFIWWYWFKNWGARAMVYAGVSFVLFPVFLLLIYVFPDLIHTTIHTVFYFLFGLAIPLSAVFYFIHGKKIVPGAQDNLSGISVAFHVIKKIHDLHPQGLKNTKIKMISFGSEETGLRGSSAYAKMNHKSLIEENAVLINLDGILELNEIHIVTAEPMPWIVYDKNLIKAVSDSFVESNLKFKYGILPIGATDGASFARKKIPALTIIGLPLKGLHPTYHTRLDTPEWLNNETLNQATDALVDFAIQTDKKS